MVRTEFFAVTSVLRPILVAARSKAWVCGRLLGWIAASKPCGAMNIVLSGRRLWSFFQRSPTDCGVPECDREASTVKRPWPTRGCSTVKIVSTCRSYLRERVFESVSGSLFCLYSTLLLSSVLQDKYRMVTENKQWWHYHTQFSLYHP
jgi:hypothetical protein